MAPGTVSHSTSRQPLFNSEVVQLRVSHEPFMPWPSRRGFVHLMFFPACMSLYHDSHSRVWTMPVLTHLHAAGCNDLGVLADGYGGAPYTD